MKSSITRSRRLSHRLALAAAVSLVAGGALSAQAATVTARDAWAREAPAGRKASAIFLTAENTGGTARSIVSGSTDVSDTLELHEMKKDGEMMRMSPVASIAVPAHGNVQLRPGGLHLMLFGLRKPLAVGDTVHVTLTLDNGSHIMVAAPVRAMRQMP